MSLCLIVTVSKYRSSAKSAVSDGLAQGGLTLSIEQ